MCNDRQTKIKDESLTDKNRWYTKNVEDNERNEKQNQTNLKQNADEDVVEYKEQIVRKDKVQRVRNCGSIT